MSAAASFFLGLFIGVIIGIAVMALIQPYCCRMQPEEQD